MKQKRPKSAALKDEDFRSLFTISHAVGRSGFPAEAMQSLLENHAPTFRELESRGLVRLLPGAPFIQLTSKGEELVALMRGDYVVVPTPARSKQGAAV